MFHSDPSRKETVEIYGMSEHTLTRPVRLIDLPKINSLLLIPSLLFASTLLSNQPHHSAIIMQFNLFNFPLSQLWRLLRQSLRLRSNPTYTQDHQKGRPPPLGRVRVPLVSRRIRIGYRVPGRVHITTAAFALVARRGEARRGCLVCFVA
jgi:hypothetical protein